MLSALSAPGPPLTLLGLGVADGMEPITRVEEPTTVVTRVPVGRALSGWVRSIVKVPMSVCCWSIASTADDEGRVNEYAQIISTALRLLGVG